MSSNNNSEEDNLSFPSRSKGRERRSRRLTNSSRRAFGVSRGFINTRQDSTNSSHEFDNTSHDAEKQYSKQSRGEYQSHGESSRGHRDNRNHNRRQQRELADTFSRLNVVDTVTLADNVSLTKFTCFNRIPTELRLKIWRIAAQEERIIELEHEFGSSRTDDGINYYDRVNRSHEMFQVTKRSSLPPALLHVNSEARDEGLKFYELRIVCDGKTKNKKIYFNKNVDIIYFGEKTCISTIIFLLRTGRLSFTRVAISCSRKMESCCEWDRDKNSRFWTAVSGGITPLQALHGIWRPDIQPGYFPGCPGLIEVFWIIKSRYIPLAVGEVDASIGFRPAVGDGLTSGQVRYKRCISQYIEHIEGNNKLNGIGEENKWLGDKKPKFSFKCLAPKTYSNEIYDSIIVSRYDAFKLSKMKAFIANLEKKYRCRITIVPQDYIGEKERVIGFFGIENAIDKSKNEIIETLGHLPLYS